jgi:hypothetical protein
MFEHKYLNKLTNYKSQIHYTSPSNIMSHQHKAIRDKYFLLNLYVRTNGATCEFNDVAKPAAYSVNSHLKYKFLKTQQKELHQNLELLVCPKNHALLTENFDDTMSMYNKAAEAGPMIANNLTLRFRMNALEHVLDQRLNKIIAIRTMLKMDTIPYDNMQWSQLEAIGKLVKEVVRGPAPQ